MGIIIPGEFGLVIDTDLETSGFATKPLLGNDETLVALGIDDYRDDLPEVIVEDMANKPVIRIVDWIVLSDGNVKSGSRIVDASVWADPDIFVTIGTHSLSDGAEAYVEISSAFGSTAYSTNSTTFTTTQVGVPVPGDFADYGPTTFVKITVLAGGTLVANASVSDLNAYVSSQSSAIAAALTAVEATYDHAEFLGKRAFYRTLYEATWAVSRNIDLILTGWSDL